VDQQKDEPESPKEESEPVAKKKVAKFAPVAS
jgi:hypothetical protein